MGAEFSNWRNEWEQEKVCLHVHRMFSQLVCGRFRRCALERNPVAVISFYFIVSQLIFYSLYPDSLSLTLKTLLWYINSLWH